MLPVHNTSQSLLHGLRGRVAVCDRAGPPRHPYSKEAAEASVRSVRNAAESLGTSVRVPEADAGPSTSGHDATIALGVVPRSRTAIDMNTGLVLQARSWAGDLTSAGLWPLHCRLPLVALPIQVNEPPAQIKKQTTRPGKDPKQREDFYANVGEAIRVLRAEIPLLFQEDLSYDIYRDDITFRDPRNTFTGKNDYRTIFWSLRFHGKLFFRVLYVDVLRIWESPENVKDAGTVLKMRWSVHGIPRVPWDAEGIFDGISTFKLDSSGKIFEHAVNNVILKDPPKEGNPFLAGLNLIPLPQPQQPCPGAWFKATRDSEHDGEESKKRPGSKEAGESMSGGSFVEQF